MRETSPPISPFINGLEKLLLLFLPILFLLAAVEVPLLGQRPVETPDPRMLGRIDNRGELLHALREARRKGGEIEARRPWREFLYDLDQKGSETIEDSNLFGFYPRLDFVARGSGLSAGLRYWRPAAWKGVDLLGSAYYSWNQYQHFDLQAGLIPNRGKGIPPSSLEEEDVDELGELERARLSRFKLYLSGRYRFQPEVSYFGSGADSKLEGESSFLRKDLRSELVAGYQLTDRLAWTLRTGLLQHSLGPGRDDNVPSVDQIYDDSTAPGLASPPNYQTLTSTFLLDFRDSPMLPRKGFLAVFGFEHFNEIGGTDRFNFSRYAFDGRAYLPIWSSDRVLALRAVGVWADPDDENQVPFFLKPSLGSSHILRGYRSYRFRADKLIQLQAEYRWEASRRFGLALFGDTGTVADKGTRLSLSKLRSDFGIGLRIYTSRRTIFRIDQAWSNEGPRTILRFSGAF